MNEEPKHVTTRNLIHQLKQSMEEPSYPLGPCEIRQPLSDETIRYKLGMIRELEERMEFELKEYVNECKQTNEVVLLKRIDDLEAKVERLMQIQNFHRLMESVRQADEEQCRKKLNAELTNLFETISSGINRIMELSVKK